MAHQMKNSKNNGGSNLGVEEESGTTVVVTASGGLNNNAPKYGTVVPNRIFVGGISPTTTELDLNQLFSSAYGRVTGTKIIQDRAGVSKGYGFVTFETEEEAKRVLNDSDNIVLKERRLNIAPAVKKQAFSRGVENGAVVVGQPAQVFQQNGVSFSYHNGMAFFNSGHPQQTIDPTIYQSYAAAATPQVAQFAPVLYSTQMYYQGPPQQYPPPQYQIPYGGVGEGVYEGSGGEMYATGTSGGYPNETTTATCYPVQAYPLHEYRRILAIPPPTHFYEPHYIEQSEGTAKPDSKADLPGEKTPVVSLAKLKDDGGWNKKTNMNNRRNNNNNNPSTANRNLPMIKSPPPAPYSPMVRPYVPPPPPPPPLHSSSHEFNPNPRSRPPLQVPQFPYYQQAVVPAPPRGYVSSSAPLPAPPPPPSQRRSSANHQRRNNSGRRGRGSRSGSSGGGGGEPLTPPTTPRSSPPPHHQSTQSTPVQQQITSSVQALTL